MTASTEKQDPKSSAIFILNRASIEIPESLDNDAFMRDLEDSHRGFWLEHVALAPQALKGDLDALDDLTRAAASFAAAFREVQSRWGAASSLREALEPPGMQWAAIGHEFGAARSAGMPNIHPAHRIELIHAEVQAIRTAARGARQCAEELVQGYPNLAKADAQDGRRHEGAFGRLVAERIPGIFERHLGRKCHITRRWEGGAGSEGLRFVISAVQYLKDTEQQQVNHIDASCDPALAEFSLTADSIAQAVRRYRQLYGTVSTME